MPNWSDILEEIKHVDAEIRTQSAHDTVRRKYLERLFKETNRNVIAYYSGWLSKPGLDGTQITDEDKNGFMMAVHELDRSRGLDLILHTPGGELNATESIVDYLYRMFKSDIRAIVPQIAMSGGTLIACTSKQIVMGAHSNLGPIDPQVQGVPAIGVIEEFKNAAKEIEKEPSKVHVWQPILSKYHPTFLSQCQHAIDHSSEVAKEYLEKIMFENDPDRERKSKKIVNGLTDYSGNKSHARHIHINECSSLGLKVAILEKDQDLQDSILSIHHAYMISLMNSKSFKIIENHLGRAFVNSSR